MARPRKEGRLRMDTSLRIPVTSEQKALIVEATSDEPEGMAAWARAVLIDAARRKIALCQGSEQPPPPPAKEKVRAAAKVASEVDKPGT